MPWNNPEDFFAMGGYGLYVWGSYAVALLVMVLEPLQARLRHRAAMQDAARRSDAAEDLA